MRISYGFGGKDAPLQVKVYNKLSVPLFVDWSRSSMVYNGKAKSFIPDELKFSGTISTDTRNVKTLSSAESNLKGTVETQKQVTFIPPGAGIETIIQAFDSDVFKTLSDSLYKENDYLSTPQGTVQVKVGNFDQSNSPIVFRTYLTLHTQAGQQINTFAVDKLFYISKSIRTLGRPESFFEYSSPGADVFYSSRTTSYGKTMTGVGVAAILVGAAAVQPSDAQK